MTTKEKARNYVWSRIESTEREYRQIHKDIENNMTGIVGMDQLETRLDATDRKLDMYNYLFKLIELDED
jgi:hypothetical protein